MSSLTDTNDARRGDAHRYDADSAVLGIFLFTTLVLGLAQAYLFAHLLGAPLAALAPVLVSRAAQGLVLIAVRAATATPWYASRRTEALCAAFALLSAFQLDSNRRLLVLSAGASPMAQALIATCVAVALAFHAALPLVEGRIAPDLSAYMLTALAHAAYAPLERSPPPLDRSRPLPLPLDRSLVGDATGEGACVDTSSMRPLASQPLSPRARPSGEPSSAGEPSGPGRSLGWSARRWRARIEPMCMRQRKIIIG